MYSYDRRGYPARCSRNRDVRSRGFCAPMIVLRLGPPQPTGYGSCEDAVFIGDVDGQSPGSAAHIPGASGLPIRCRTIIHGLGQIGGKTPFQKRDTRRNFFPWRGRRSGRVPIQPAIRGFLPVLRKVFSALRKRPYLCVQPETGCRRQKSEMQKRVVVLSWKGEF